MWMAVRRTVSRGTARNDRISRQSVLAPAGYQHGRRALTRTGDGSRSISGATLASLPETPHIHGQRGRGERKGEERCTSRLHEVRRIDGQRTYPYTQGSADAQSLSCFSRATRVPWAAFPLSFPRFLMLRSPTLGNGWRRGTMVLENGWMREGRGDYTGTGRWRIISVSRVDSAARRVWCHAGVCGEGGREGGKVRCWLGLWGIVYACTMGVGPVSGSGFRSCGLLVSWAVRCSGWGS